MAGRRKGEGDEVEEFQDFLPIMAQKLSEQEFLEELCNGFRLLADPCSGNITFSSLKKNARWLGLEGMTDEELQAMIDEGDTNGDGALNEHEFCVLMIRTSPSLLAQAQDWLDDALEAELTDYMDMDDIDRLGL